MKKIQSCKFSELRFVHGSFAGLLFPHKDLVAAAIESCLHHNPNTPATLGEDEKPTIVYEVF